MYRRSRDGRMHNQNNFDSRDSLINPSCIVFSSPVASSTSSLETSAKSIRGQPFASGAFSEATRLNLNYELPGSIFNITPKDLSDTPNNISIPSQHRRVSVVAPFLISPSGSGSSKRIQHTLQSISSRQSRSRSPIVDRDGVGGSGAACEGEQVLLPIETLLRRRSRIAVQYYPTRREMPNPVGPGDGRREFGDPALPTRRSIININTAPTRPNLIELGSLSLEALNSTVDGNQNNFSQYGHDTNSRRFHQAQQCNIAGSVGHRRSINEEIAVTAAAPQPESLPLHLASSTEVNMLNSSGGGAAATVESGTTNTSHLDPLGSLERILASLETGAGGRNDNNISRVSTTAAATRRSSRDDQVNRLVGVAARRLSQPGSICSSSSRRPIELQDLPSSSMGRTTIDEQAASNGGRRQMSNRSSSRSETIRGGVTGGRPSSSYSSSLGASSSLTTSSSSVKLAASNAAAASEAAAESSSRRRSRGGARGSRQHEIATGFEIAWLDFTYSVEPNILEDPRWGMVNKLFHKERRMILKGLSGGFKSGQMVALMGPSGAGKTCLLESISGVRTTGIGGRMCLRGRKRAQLVIVPQYDDFMPQFSVEETIVYGSRMKNPAGTNHRQVANTVIEQLGLQACRHNNIQRCSGGQRKRVAIAQELVSKPNILILDEPTSGLDSSCCYHTVKVLRDVLDQSVKTDEPMVIVSTIHQPSAKVFKMFDLIYLLGKTGYMAYSGPPDELLPTISDVAGLECPKYSNPSDFMIELVAYDYGEEPVERLIEFERQKAIQYVKDFEKRSGLSAGSIVNRSISSTTTTTKAAATTTTEKESSSMNCENAAPPSATAAMGLNGSSSRASSIVSFSMTTLTTMPRLAPSKSDTHLADPNRHRMDQVQRRLKTSDLLNGVSHVIYKNNVTLSLRKATSNDNRRHPFIWHTWVHLHRSFLQAIRDPILNNMRILIHLGFAALLVLLYGKKSGEARGCPPVLGLPREITNPNNESMIDLADNVGYLFMCIMMITYVSLMSTVLTFPIDIKTVGKEYKNGWYGTISYFIGKTVADLPFIVFYPVVYCLITWFMTNQAQGQYWRFFSFTGMIIMNAMNSQSFGLILGALFVNSVTAATFLGPVITIPWYLFTGFTKRTHRLAEPFKSASKFLFTRHIFEGLLDTVYGHQRCNCSEFLRQYHELRFEEASRLGQLVSIETLSSLDYYDDLETVADVVNETLFPPKAGATPNWLERTVDAATSVFADGDDLDLASLMETNVKASSMFSFGLDFEPSCPSDYETYIIQDFRLRDRSVEKTFLIVLSMLCCIRVLTFVLVAWKIRTRQL